ncbi:translation initiation factor IF-2 N-terminal domain-containing protein [Rhodococcus gannanensis]|uniref:Translation initiation factor IF-2 N-terminal domain-containing protein n=1 Tax=Rhodococcus gannanensis TaxID=1960308 RepID=A0ABW4P0D6_9NOCA
MADKAPHETSQPATPVFPEKMRVHALAKILGLTSKQVLAQVADFGVELRSAQSSIDRALAERVHTALHAPTENAPTGETSATEPAPAPADETTAVQASPDLIAEAQIPAQSGLFTDTSTQEAPAAPTEVPVFQAPLFLQPEAAEAPPRRRRARREAAAPDEDTPIEVTTAATPAAEEERPDQEQTTATVAEEAAPKGEQAEHDDESEGQGRRRRRGRRGRGRGRGESEAAGDTGDGSEQTAERSTEPESDTESKDAETKDDAAAADTTAAEAEAEGAEAKDSEDTDDSEGGTSRRRRRRRRRKGSDATDSAEDDGVTTVVHEREPRTKARAAKDEVQGISGSTRLEAKRQRRRDGRDAGRRRPPILTESEFLARRESVDRVMVVREKSGQAHPDGLTQVAVLEDDILVEHFVTTSASASMVGNVYLGRVQNVLPSMEAAFIDIGRGRNGVLYAGEVNWEAAGLGGNSRKIEQALKPGDQVLVQVSKDPVGHKGARLTTQISLAGRFLVYVPGGTSTGISRKLPDTERKRLKEILREVVPPEAGVIIRTAAEGVSEEELSRDVQRLQSQWAEIEEHAAAADKGKSGNPKALYEEPDMLVKVVRDLFNEDFSKIVIEGEKSWSTVENYIRTVAPDLLPRVERYEPQAGGPDVFTVRRIDEQLSKALDRKVWLPSGGTLVIDRTEAMTVVDVNTGKFTGAGGNLEETVTRNNLEAAEEIVRQMRLRDIGGMIVVDFIDMVLESNRDLVLRRLTEALGRDRTRHQVSEVTSLGLVQMTRKKLGTGLVEAFSTTCEHCHGRGIVVHADPVEVRGGDDGGSRAQGKSESGGSRRKRGGRDKSGSGEQQQSAPEKNGHGEADASAKRAHPVALAMAAHLHEESAEGSATQGADGPAESTDVSVSESTDATVEVASAETEAPSTAAADKTDRVESPAASEVAEPAETAPVSEPEVITESVGRDETEAGDAETPAVEVAAAEAEPEAAAPARGRRRSRRASRATSAPEHPEGPEEGTVVVIAKQDVAAAEPEVVPVPEPLVAAGDGAAAPVAAEPVAPKRRPRRRAAGRPAGPPIEA